MDLLDLDAPVEEFRLHSASDLAERPEIVPTFNHRNHLNALFTQGRSTWLGIALNVPGARDLPSAELGQVFSDLLSSHDALRWAVFPADSSSFSSPFFSSSTPPFSVHCLHPSDLSVEALPAESPADLTALISHACSPISSPGAFFGRSGDTVLVSFDHFHVDMISMDLLARELYVALRGEELASEKENTPSYSTVLEQRAEVEDHTWSEQLADEVWGEFFAETSGTVPGFPVDLGAHGTTHPAAFVVTTLLSAEQMNSKVDAQPFPELLTAVARVLGRRVPMLIPMHTRGKNGSAAHSTVGWLVGNAPVVAEPEESPDTAKMWLRRAVAGQGLSIEKVLDHYQAEFPSATIFSASFVDFTKRGGAVPGASYISSRGPVDSVQMWFSRTETGIQLRMCYPDTHFTREFMPEFVDSLRAELAGRR